MTERLGLMFVSNNDQNNLLSCESTDGFNWSGTVGVNITDQMPGQVIFRCQIYTAFTRDKKIFVMRRPDGQGWTDQTDTGQTTEGGVSLAVFAGKLWIGYVGIGLAGDRSVCVTYSDDGTKWSFGVSIPGNSGSSDASLAVFQNKMFIAFLSNNSEREVLICESADGIDWTNNYRCNQRSSKAPALTVYNGSMWLAFVADNDSNDLLTASSSDGLNWSGKNFRVRQSSKAAPSLTAFNGQMWMAFLADNGTNGILLCNSSDGMTWSGGRQVGQASKTAPVLYRSYTAVGSLRAKYHVLALLYAPPGTNGGKGSSSAQYGSTSSVGTSNTIKSSFSNEIDFTAKGGLGLFQGDDTFSVTNTVTDSTQIEVKVTKGDGLGINGPAADGIDHDLDQFYLWLNPTIDLMVDSNGANVWSLRPAGVTLLRQRVSVGELKRPDTVMDPGVKAQLESLGFTKTDYDAILALNPFSYQNGPIDENRFSPSNLSYPYRRPDRGSVDPPVTHTESTATTVTSTKTIEAKYSTSYSFEVGTDEIVSAEMKDKLEWTNSSAKSEINGETYTSTFSIGGPSADYPISEPREIYAYYDRIFCAWLFSFEPPI